MAISTCIEQDITISAYCIECEKELDIIDDDIFYGNITLKIAEHECNGHIINFLLEEARKDPKLTEWLEQKFLEYELKPRRG